MFSYFKSNNPGVVGFYIFYFVLFYLIGLGSPAASTFSAQHNEPLYRLFTVSVLPLLTSNIIYATVSSVLIFMMALLINGIVNDNKITRNKTYAGGALFIILLAFFPAGLYLNPVLLSLFFAVLAFKRLMPTVRTEKPFSMIFDGGFLIAVASLFYAPMLFLLPVIFIGLGILRPPSIREWIIILFGFLAPFFLTFTVYFSLDLTDRFFSDILNTGQQSFFAGPWPSGTDWLPLGFLSGLLVVSGIMIPGNLFSSVIQVRKIVAILWILILFLVIAFFFQHVFTYQHFLLLAFPLSVVYTLLLAPVKRSWIVEVFHIMLILFALTCRYFIS